MTEGVVYKLSIQDYLSQGLNKIRSNAKIVFGSVNSDVKKLGKELDYTGRNIATLERYMKQLERRRKISIDDTEITNLNKKLQSVETRIRNIKTAGVPASANFATGGGGNAGMLGAAGLGRLRMAGVAATVAGIALAGATIKNSVGVGMETQANRVAFDTMSGSAGTKLYEDVTDYAQKTIYGKEQYGFAKTQLAFGFNAQEVMPNLKMLGDIAMGDRQRMESLNLVYSQVRANTKLTGQDLHQFVNAGFNPLQEISRTTGKSMQQLHADMSEGKVSFDMVRGALQSATGETGRFYKMVDKIAKTDFGKKQVFQGNVDAAMIKLGELTSPFVGRMLDKYGTSSIGFFENKITPTIGKALQMAEDLMPTVGEIIKSTGNLVRPVVGLLTSDNVKNLLIQSGNLAAKLENGLSPVVEALTTSLGKLIPIVTKTANFFNGATGNLSLIGKEGQGAEDFYSPIPERNAIRAADFKALNMRLNGQKPTMSIGELLDPRKMLTRGRAFPTLVNPALLNMPVNSVGNTLAAMSGGGGGISSGSSDAITSGGSKTTILNFNAPLVAAGGIVQNISGGTALAMSEVERIVSETFKRITTSIER